jgi:hypothetical protein
MGHMVISAEGGVHMNTKRQRHNTVRNLEREYSDQLEEDLGDARQRLRQVNWRFEGRMMKEG